MLYNENTVYVLSQRQIRDIVKNRAFSIDDLLEKVAQCDGSDMKHAAAESLRGPTTAAPQYSSAESRGIISTDDILDLRIELETCRDSLEFINRQ